MTSHSIADWTFDPDLNEIRRGDERRRLEHRAARTLELLYARAGEVVTPQEIIAQVWNGRAISPNSVPVVISDLRQALEDDARQPRYIETVAKRGYRLLTEPDGKGRARRKRLRAAFIALAVIALALAATIAWTTLGRDASSPVLVVGLVQNATGDPAYQPLANASSAVLMAQAEQLSGLRVYQLRSPDPAAIKLESWLYIWEGKPTVMMSAHRAGGPVLWTGITAGGEDRIPQDIAAAMRRLGERLTHLSGDTRGIGKGAPTTPSGT